MAAAVQGSGLGKLIPLHRSSAPPASSAPRICSVTETHLQLAHSPITWPAPSSLLLASCFHCKPVRLPRPLQRMRMPSEGARLHTRSRPTTPASPSSARRTFDRPHSTPASSLLPAKWLACAAQAINRFREQRDLARSWNSAICRLRIRCQPSLRQSSLRSRAMLCHR